MTLWNEKEGEARASFLRQGWVWALTALLLVVLVGFSYFWLRGTSVMPLPAPITTEESISVPETTPSLPEPQAEPSVSPTPTPPAPELLPEEEQHLEEAPPVAVAPSASEEIEPKQEAIPPAVSLPERVTEQERVAHLERQLMALQAQQLKILDMVAESRHALTLAKLGMEVWRRLEQGLKLEPVLNRFPEGMPPSQHQALERLQALDRQGIPSRATLLIDFTDLADRYVRAAPDEGSAPWYRRVWQWVGQLIVVRKVGDVEGSDDEAVLARSEWALKQGDVESALRQMEALSSRGRAYFAAWLRRAGTLGEAMHQADRLDASGPALP